MANIGSVSGTATAAQNTFTSAKSSRSVTIDGTTVSLPAMPASSQSLTAAGQFTVDNFITVSGSLVIDSSAQSLTLSDGSTVNADLLKIGGSGLTGLRQDSTVLPQPVLLPASA
ncbi:MAG UNVERIFIED_CONTAM: hypothetical protein LVR18_03035 [Planctomycetaceae bacterium]|jgi:hypothetical protein